MMKRPAAPAASIVAEARRQRPGARRSRRMADQAGEDRGRLCGGRRQRPPGAGVCGAVERGFGQQFVVENRTGGGGLIGAEAVARSEPDGYTLMASGMPSHVLAPAMNPKNANFDPVRDFTHVAYLGGPPNVFVVHASSPVKSFKELLALMRSQAERRRICLAEHRLGRQRGRRIRRREGEDQAGARRLPWRRRRDPRSRRRPREGRQHDARHHAAAHPFRRAASARDLVGRNACPSSPTCRPWRNSAIRNWS